MHRIWEWDFASPPAAIWPSLADTARFNEAAALPKHEIIETPRPDGSVDYAGRLRKGPFVLEWRERPVNWVAEQWFEHCRDFGNGPFRSLCATFELAPSAGGSHGRYRLEAIPAGPLGRLVLMTGFLDKAGRTFAKLAAEADEFAQGRRTAPFDYVAPEIDAATQNRVAAIVKDLDESPNGHGLARRLADHVLQAQEVDLWQIRPLKLARQWRVGAREAIELCLQAVRSGLLELRWDLLCPRCRVAKSSSTGLDRLPSGAHCSTCNIDYDRDFARNVEASFRPAASVRDVTAGQYCLFGPMSTPHIKLHVTVSAGETRSLKAVLPPGDYRLRTLEPGPELSLAWQGGGFPEFVVDGAEIRAGDAAPPGTIALRNRANRTLTFVVEDRAWVQDALTADRVTALQAFRDLFAHEALRPGDDVGVGRIALMFTDLKGSTAFYERVGDARAYHLVRDHFAFLGGIVREHDGAIVKTIGDAVMAAFTDPAQAMRAAIAIQQQVGAFNRDHGEDSILIKLGLHVGPCIVVTLNDRLDYFGSAVNLAARLQGQSAGGDIVLSADMTADAAVAGLLSAYRPVRESAPLRGFDRPIEFYRLAAADRSRPAIVAGAAADSPRTSDSASTART
jgi:class 3 adenylate cyclase